MSKYECVCLFKSPRLAEQLRGWMVSQEEEMKQKDKKRQSQRRKSSSSSHNNNNNNKDSREFSPLKRFGGKSSVGAYSQGLAGVSTMTGSQYPVQVFSGGYDARQQFLNAIPRRNDTFYVLSFSTVRRSFCLFAILFETAMFE